jgi:uncharacterized protein YuzE
MKVEYDSERDLLYLSSNPEAKAAKTVAVAVAPGCHADSDAQGKLIGIEVLNVSERLGGRVRFEVELASQALPLADWRYELSTGIMRRGVITCRDAGGEIGDRSHHCLSLEDGRACELS